MQVMKETHTQLFRGSRQGGTGVPGPHILLGARTKADIPFAHALAGSRFSRIVVQRQFRVCEHQK